MDVFFKNELSGAPPPCCSRRARRAHRIRRDDGFLIWPLSLLTGVAVNTGGRCDPPGRYKDFRHEGLTCSTSSSWRWTVCSPRSSPGCGGTGGSVFRGTRPPVRNFIDTCSNRALESVHRVRRLRHHRPLGGDPSARHGEPRKAHPKRSPGCDRCTVSPTASAMPAGPGRMVRTSSSTRCSPRVREGQLALGEPERLLLRRGRRAHRAHRAWRRHRRGDAGAYQPVRDADSRIDRAAPAAARAGLPAALPGASDLLADDVLRLLHRGSSRAPSSSTTSRSSSRSTSRCTTCGWFRACPPCSPAAGGTGAGCAR